jgi:hypothetical protein
VALISSVIAPPCTVAECITHFATCASARAAGGPDRHTLREMETALAKDYVDRASLRLPTVHVIGPKVVSIGHMGRFLYVEMRSSRWRSRFVRC